MMNEVEADYSSEFVEVDPTGRYGRVCPLSPPSLISFIWAHVDDTVVFSLFVAV